jgi:hypothetical protein
MRSLLILTILLTLTGSAFAQERDYAKTWEQSHAIAKLVWHDPCANLPMKVERTRDMPPAQVGRHTLAWAFREENREGQIIGCYLKISTRHRFSDLAFCTILVHEYGHLAEWRAPKGQGYIYYSNGNWYEDRTHSWHAGKIMYPVIGKQRAHRRCKATFGNHWKIRRVK